MILTRIFIQLQSVSNNKGRTDRRTDVYAIAKTKYLQTMLTPWGDGHSLWTFPSGRFPCFIVYPDIPPLGITSACVAFLPESDVVDGMQLSAARGETSRGSVRRGCPTSAPRNRIVLPFKLFFSGSLISEAITI